jgi:flagellar biosynthesis/type III secretory pathway protein FliH
MTPQNKHKKEESSFEEWLDITIEETYDKGYSEGFKAGREGLKTALNAVRNVLKDHTITAPHVEALILTREMALIMIEKELSSLSKEEEI